MATFLNYLVIGILLGGLYGLLALPLSLIQRTTGVLDIVVGGYVVAAGIVAAKVGWPLGALAGVGTAVGLSAVTTLFFVVFQRMHGVVDGLGMSLGTFGLVIAVTGGIVTVFGTNSEFAAIVNGSWRPGGIVLTKGYVLSFAVALTLALIVILALERTSMGLRMRASAVNAEHAELLGVPVRRVQYGTFLIGGLLAGVVGLMAVSTVGVGFSSTIQFSILALSAAVLLGMRGPASAFVGGIALGIFDSLAQGYGGETVGEVVPSVLILLVLSSGLFTLRGTEARA